MQVESIQIVCEFPEHKRLRIATLLCRELGEEAMLTAVWERPNGYGNIGTFVVETTTSQETHYHLVIQYGMDYCLLRIDQPRDVLLALDGFEMVVEYRERIRGAVIDPSEQQAQAFAAHYPLALERWLAQAMTLGDMDHPRFLSDISLLDAVFAHFDDQATHLRAKRFLWSLWASYDYPECSAWERVKAMTDAARQRLYQWWKGACADYDYPPAPESDHDTLQVLARLDYNGRTYTRVEAFGQVAVVSVMYEFFSRTDPGFDLVDRESLRRINAWLPTNPGGKEGAHAYARRLSRLADWSQFDRLTRRQKYGLGVRVDELLLEMLSAFREKEEQ
jgi:hypothetical protein